MADVTIQDLSAVTTSVAVSQGAAQIMMEVQISGISAPESRKMGFDQVITIIGSQAQSSAVSGGLAASTAQSVGVSGGLADSQSRSVGASAGASASVARSSITSGNV